MQIEKNHTNPSFALYKSALNKDLYCINGKIYFSIYHLQVPIGKMEFHVHQNHTSHEDRKHRCHLCGKGFIYPHKLQEHLNTHTGIKL